MQVSGQALVPGLLVEVRTPTRHTAGNVFIGERNNDFTSKFELVFFR